MSQSVEISSENVAESQEVAESVKPTADADVIQIPVELESEAVSEAAGDVSLAEDDRTLEQVADIAVDVSQEPTPKQSIPRASLDDVLDLPSESTEPASVSSEPDKSRTTSVTTRTVVLQQTEGDISIAQKSSSAEDTTSKKTGTIKKDEEQEPSPRKMAAALTSYTAGEGLIEIPVQIEPTTTETVAETAPVEEIFRQIPVEEEKPGVIEVPIEEVPYRTGAEEAQEIESRSVPVEYTEEPSGVSAEPSEIRKKLEYERKAEPPPPREERLSKKKSRKEVLEEVQHALAVEILEKGTLAPPPKPSHVTYASWAPPRIHAPSYTPYSSLIAPEPKYRNRYTAAYHYTPPAMTRLNEFDDYVKIGAYGQDLWATDRALQRSRSLDRRPPPGARQRTYVGPSPIGRRARLSAVSYSAPPSRSSSASNLMDYVSATRYELKRSASRNAVGADEQTYVRTDYGRVIPSSESVAQPWTVYEKMAAQTENYLRRLHEPYEATTPSYYKTYTGRSYNPYCALPLRQDRVYHYFDRLSEEERAQPRLERAYESRLNQFMIDIYRDRDSRSRAHRDASYAAFAEASPFSRTFATPARPYYSSYPQYGVPHQRSSFRPDFVAQPISLSPAFATRNRYYY